MRKILLLGLVSTTAVLSGPARAAEDVKTDLSLSGQVDGYYSYNFNNPAQTAVPSTTSVSGASLQPATNTYRYYDSYHNQMTLDLAELNLKAKRASVMFTADFDFGKFADLNASSGPGGVVDESSKNIGQAYLSYAPANSNMTVDAGKMSSHLGVESTKASDNFNYSRSLLFSYAIPFWHTGIAVGTFIVPEKIQIKGFVYNGWNQVDDINHSKTLGAQVRFTPNADTSVSYNFIGGPERADSERDLRVVHELNATFSSSKRASFIADAVYGSEENAPVGAARVFAKWSGALIGLHYALTDRDSISPRYEIYRDMDGYTLSGPAQSLNSVTLTYDRLVDAGFDVRVEGRGDFSDQSVFKTDKGVSSSQVTALIAGLFKF